jgi:FG-GAP repeat
MRTPNLLVAAALATAATGCSWSAFDNLADETWVDRAGAPAGANSILFGEQLAAGGLRGDGANIVVLGRSNPTVSRLAFDGNGVRTQVDAGDIQNSLQFASFQEHPAVAGDPASTKVAFALVTRNGSDPDSNTKVAVYDAANFDTIVKAFEPGPDLKAPKKCNSLVFAEVDGDPGLSDLVMARDDQVMVVTDWASSDTAGGTFRISACVHADTTSYAVAVADLNADTQPEILLSTGSANRDMGGSRIKIFEPSAVTAYSAGPAIDCFPTGSPAMSIIDKTNENVNDLGAQLAVVDFGMGPWIVATSPQNNKLYVFEDMMGTSEIDVAGPSGAGDFGSALAVGDLDGDGVPELIVGAPKSTVDGVTNAGAVYVLQFNGTGFDVAATLHDASPEVEQHFGKSVAVAPFGTGTSNILVAGADGEVFTYFRTLVYMDVRAGHQ